MEGDPKGGKGVGKRGFMVEIVRDPVQVGKPKELPPVRGERERPYLYVVRRDDITPLALRFQ